MSAYTNYKSYIQSKKCCKPIGLQGPQGPAGEIIAPTAYNGTEVICEASGSYWFVDVGKLQNENKYLVLWDNNENAYYYLTVI